MPDTLEIEHLSRSFPGVIALEDVSLTVRQGEVHALVGENGAGKSTLINIISGVLPPDHGTIRLDGAPAGLTDPVTARQRGVVTVHQEADLFGTLSVYENMALQTGLPTTAWGRVKWKEARARARQAVAPLGEDFDIRQPARRLSVAHRHLSQVAAALVEKARIVILDEPTSVLTLSESEWLFEQIGHLREAGVGIIYISHRQEEIFSLADRISVLRDGHLVWTGAKTEVDGPGLVSHMVGRAMDLPTRHESQADHGSCVLRVRDLTDRHGRFKQIDLDVHAGEVVGLYGLIGSGRSEFAQAVFGLEPARSGSIEIDGQRVQPRRPAEAVEAGIAYVPEDRLRQAVCRELSICDNGVLATLDQWSWGPWISRRRETEAVTTQAERFHVRYRTPADPIEQLSGGNQQKVILARWVLAKPKVLLLDEPTRGVDVAAKAEIHGIIRELADQGTAVLLISSELPEVLAHADRIGVFREGRLVRTLEGPEATAVAVAEAALPQSGPSAPAEGERWQGQRSIDAESLSGIGLALAVLLVGGLLATTTEGRFTDPANLWNLASNLAPRAILAFAAATVILAGAIDISVGSLIALAAAVGGIAMTSVGGTLGVFVGIVAGLATGIAGSALNGALAVAGRIHPIVVTLGAMTIYRGMVIIVTDSGVVSGLPPAFGALATGRLLGLPGSVWILLATAIGMVFWLGHTRWGRHLYAVGSSPSAARLVGISKGVTWLLAFTVAGLLVGLAGMLELAQNRTMQPTMGVGYELRAIAAAVIGGVAIEGGRGTIFGVLLGALLLLMIENGLVLWQVSGSKYDLVIGALLLSAILLDRLLRRAER